MEYQLLMEVRDEAGKLLSRQTVGCAWKCSLLPPEPKSFFHG
jgi:hypothetical protein